MKWVSKWGEWMSECVSNWVSEWVEWGEWVSEWVRWVGEWGEWGECIQKSKTAESLTWLWVKTTEGHGFSLNMPLKEI